MTFIKEPDVLPVKIRFKETSQFSEGSANVSVRTFLSRLQKLSKIGRPRDITLRQVEITGRKPHVKYNSTHLKEQDSLLIVPVKVRFDDTTQFSQG